MTYATIALLTICALTSQQVRSCLLLLCDLCEYLLCYLFMLGLMLAYLFLGLTAYLMTTNFFNNLEPVKFNDSDSNLAFRHYQPEKLVLGKSMREHFAVCRLLLA